LPIKIDRVYFDLPLTKQQETII